MLGVLYLWVHGLKLDSIERRTLNYAYIHDPALVEAARGMGMTRTQVLFWVELRLAVPVILAGLRTALVLTVGVARSRRSSTRAASAT